MQVRSERWKDQNTVPLNTKGQSLLAGNVYCGHCGAKLTLTTSGCCRKRKDGTVDNTRRVRYACYGKTRKQTDCDGQTGYTMHILDDLIDEIVRGIFAKMKGVSRDDIIRLRYKNELELRKAHLLMLTADHAKALDNLNVLKGEVVKAIKGESAFSADTLSGLIADAEKECERLGKLCVSAEQDVTDSEQVFQEVTASYDTLISWADLYDDASFEKKKMIVNCLINRVDVYRGYKLHIDFNFDYEQFLNGLDSEAA